MTDTEDYFLCLAIRYLQRLAQGTFEERYANERDGFTEWAEIGAPMLFEDELRAYLADNPLS